MINLELELQIINAEIQALLIDKEQVEKEQVEKEIEEGNHV